MAAERSAAKRGSGRLLRIADRTPVGLRDMWVHHGLRAGLVVVIAVVIARLFPGTTLPDFDGVSLDSVSNVTVNAEFGFNVPKDPDRLQAEQDAAAEGVTPILHHDPSLADSSLARVREFIASVAGALAEAEALADANSLDAAGRLNLVRDTVHSVARAYRITLNEDAEIDYLIDFASRQALLAEVEVAFDELRSGRIRGTEVAELGEGNVLVRSSIAGEPGGDQVREVASIRTLDDFYANAQSYALVNLAPAGFVIFQQLVLLAQPSLTIDQDATRAARASARATAPLFSGTVVEGERIVTEDVVVDSEAYDRLEAYRAAISERGTASIGSGFVYALGRILMSAAILGVLTLTMYRFARETYENLATFLTLHALVLIVAAVAGLVAAANLSPAFVPIVLAGILAAVLFDSLLALVVVGVVTGVIIVQPQFSGLPPALILASSGATAAFAVRGLRQRSRSWIFIGLVTASYAGTALLLGLTGYFSLTQVWQTTLLGFGNATVCTALAMGAMLPLLESFTGKTTDQSLTELSDMNRPLLRRLSREAPGTYAHTINLANLVEAACEAIGADALRGRVGVYYHDIGKLEGPHFFIENQPSGLNPHDRLTPWQSAEVLRAHVRNGLRLANEARLPEVVKDFIREHHGTQLIQFFYAKAMAEAGDKGVDPGDFAYDGPKPQSRETGVAMLGDAVEAASRTLRDPSPERTRALIDRLVTERVEAGELDECQLTFRDLRIVKQQFARVIMGLHHHRIDYPTPAGKPSPPEQESEGD